MVFTFPASISQESEFERICRTLGEVGETGMPVEALVGSRTGAVLRRFSLSVAPRFLWECLTSQTVNWFPAPAASNPSCRFPAMGLPACFASRVMRRFCLHLDI